MRSLLLIPCLVAQALFAGELTLVLDIQQPAGRSSIAATIPSDTRAELTRELNDLFRPANLNLSVRFKHEVAAGESFGDVVVVRMQGTCKMIAMPPIFDERGPYAWAHTVDGRVLPFVEVQCDKVRRSVGEARSMGQKKILDGDRLMGRALARVIAHEVMHIKGDTTSHGDSGVFRHALKPAELVADKVAIHADDLERLAAPRE